MPREARVCDMHRAGTRTGLDSVVFGSRIEKHLLRSDSELEIPIGSAAYKACPGLLAVQPPVRMSFAEQGAPSMPRGARRDLRERIDLIVVATGKRQ